MPFKSESQRRFLWAKHPTIAKKWSHEFPGQKDLPDHVSGSESSSSKEAAMQHITQLAARAAEGPYLHKFAVDTGLNEQEIRYLSNLTQIPVISFCKQAYEDPQAFHTLVHMVKEAAKNKAHYGAKGWSGDLLAPERSPVPSVTSPTAGAGLDVLNKDPKNLIGGPIDTATPLSRRTPLPISDLDPHKVPDFAKGLKRDAARAAQQAVAPAVTQPAASGLQNLLSRISKGGILGKGGLIGTNPKARMAAGGVGLLGTLLAGGAAKNMLGGSSTPPAPEPTPEPDPMPMPTPTPQGSGGGKPGMSTGLKGLLLAGGAGAGAYGLSKLLGRKKKKEAYAMDHEFVKRAMVRAIVTKVAALEKQAARQDFSLYLDKIASCMPMNTQHRVRTLQAAVCQGRPLSHAIKMAYPHLTGEQRGILATKLVKAASDNAFKKRANSGIPTTEPMTQTGPATQFSSMMNKVASQEKQANPMMGGLQGLAQGLKPKTGWSGAMGSAQQRMQPPVPMQQAMQHAGGLAGSAQPQGMMGQMTGMYNNAKRGLQGVGQQMMGGAQQAGSAMGGVARGLGGMFGG